MNFISIANKIGNKARREANNAIKNYGDVPDEVRTELMTTWYKAKYREYVRNLDDDLKLAFADNGLVDVLTKHGFPVKKGTDKITGKWFFVTLRPEPKHEHRFVEFKAEVEEYLKRTMFEKWMMVFEQKGETPDVAGYGYHCHILAKCADWATKQKMINDTKRGWGKWLGGDVPDAFVEIAKVETLTDRDNKIRYMTVAKADEYKQAAMLIDKIFRERYKLSDSYTSSNW